VSRECVRRVALHASQPRGINGHGAMQGVVVAGLETHHTMYIGFHFGVDGRLGVWAFGRLGVWAYGRLGGFTNENLSLFSHTYRGQIFF